MRIAVNAIFLQKTRLEGYGRFVFEVFNRLVHNHPEHEFLFLFDRPIDGGFMTAPNCKTRVVGPPARHALSFAFWYHVKAPLALRSFKPDLWVQPYGFCSLSTGIPQLLVVHDLAFLHFPMHIPWHHRWYYRMFTRSFLQKAKRVATVSAFSKADIIQHYALPEEKIDVVYSAARKGFQPLSWTEKESVKHGYADGREYFLFTGGIHPRKNLMNLLKAFSLFKKWQQSNMKLLVAGRLAWDYNDILVKLKTYKYREDVVMLDYLTDEQLTKVTGAAYAMLYPSFFEGFGLPILEAMQSGVPVITSSVSSMPEVGGEAALYADPANPDAIAKQMLRLYKDEALRSRMVEAGFKQASSFHWDTTADALWQSILSILPKSA